MFVIEKIIFIIIYRRNSKSNHNNNFFVQKFSPILTDLILRNPSSQISTEIRKYGNTSIIYMLRF